MQREPEIIREWVLALRSGKYQQTQGTLSKFDEETKTQSFCADGVLCEVMRLRDPERIRWNRLANPEFLSIEVDGEPEGLNWSMAPSSFYKKVGLDCSGYSVGGFEMFIKNEPKGFRSTARANDFGLSFEEIAEMIERYLLWDDVLMGGAK